MRRAGLPVETLTIQRNVTAKWTRRSETGGAKIAWRHAARSDSLSQTAGVSSRAFLGP
jgi:hypothetical protein